MRVPEPFLRSLVIKREEIADPARLSVLGAGDRAAVRARVRSARDVPGRRQRLGQVNADRGHRRRLWPQRRRRQPQLHLRDARIAFPAQRRHPDHPRHTHATNRLLPPRRVVLQPRQRDRGPRRWPGGGSRIIDSYGGRSLHEQSHGQSFLALLNHRFGANGLYILDEPESALSPQGQLAMLLRLYELVEAAASSSSRPTRRSCSRSRKPASTSSPSTASPSPRTTRRRPSPSTAPSSPHPPPTTTTSSTTGDRRHQRPRRTPELGLEPAAQMPMTFGST